MSRPTLVKAAAPPNNCSTRTTSWTSTALTSRKYAGARSSRPTSPSSRGQSTTRICPHCATTSFTTRKLAPWVRTKSTTKRNSSPQSISTFKTNNERLLSFTTAKRLSSGVRLLVPKSQPSYMKTSGLSQVRALRGWQECSASPRSNKIESQSTSPTSPSSIRIKPFFRLNREKSSRRNGRVSSKQTLKV